MNLSSERQAEPTALTSYIILGALSFSTLIYVALAYFLEMGRTASKIPNPPVPPTGSHAITFGLAVVSLSAATGWMLARTKGRLETGTVSGHRTQRMSPQEMQTTMIVALALAEVCVIGGLVYFFLGGRANGILPYAGGTLAVDLFVILPIVMCYWTKRNGGTSGPNVTIK